MQQRVTGSAVSALFTMEEIVELASQNMSEVGFAASFSSSVVRFLSCSHVRLSYLCSRLRHRACSNERLSSY